jgi:hypothetical protein
MIAFKIIVAFPLSRCLTANYGFGMDRLSGGGRDLHNRKLQDGLFLRAEYRQDCPDHPFFERRDSLSRKRQTAASGCLLGREHRLSLEPLGRRSNECYVD